jgi:hypothetical protein
MNPGSVVGMAAKRRWKRKDAKAQSTRALDASWRLSKETQHFQARLRWRAATSFGSGK